LQDLNNLFPNGSCAMWGLVPGNNDTNRTKWERIEVGDVVVFTGKKKVFAIGAVATKFHNPELAENLWGVDENGATWEYMYALKNVAETSIPYVAFNALLGDNPNNNHMGFRIVGDEKAEPFLEYIGVEIPPPQPSSKEIVAAISSLTFDDIQIVIDEWDEKGRDAFLKEHSLNSAFKYLLQWGDKTYDAKAIAVQAVRIKNTALAHLKANDFEGDYNTIAKPLQQSGWDVITKDELDREKEEDRQLKEIKDRVGIGPREKWNLVKSRKGQGIFKSNVLNRETKCRVTGISNAAHLRASHIKPWAKSNDTEKLDGNNGLMLAPHIDHLFDKGWITFNANGDVIFSQKCDTEIFSAFGLVVGMNVGVFTDPQDAYLEYHREKIFKK
jgi:hypothetical protein